MRKTMLALVIGATVLGAPAFAQVNLGGAVQAGAHAGGSLPVGGAMHDTMRTTDQLGRRAGDSAREIGQRARHTTHRTADQATSVVRRHGDVDTDVNADASAHAGMAGTDGGAHAGAGTGGVNAGGGLDTAGTAGRAGEAGRALGGQVRDSAHSAIQSTDRTAGSVGDAVKSTATSGTHGAIDAHGSANAQGDADAGASGGLNTAGAAGQAGEFGRGVGGEVRDSAHSAIRSTDRRAGSVGRTVKNTAAGTTTDADADANLRAKGGAHGH